MGRLVGASQAVIDNRIVGLVTLRAVLAGVFALAPAGPAPAAGQGPGAPAEDAKARGERLFEEASAAYNLGKFDEAIAKFEGAYELLKAPSLLYNLGQAHVRAHELDGDVGHLRRARALYDNFIKIREAGGESTGDAKERMAALDAKLTEFGAAQAEPEPPVEPEPEPAPAPAPKVEEPEPAPKVEAAPPRRGPGAMGITGIVLIAGGVLGGAGLAVPGFVSAGRLRDQEAAEGAVVPVSAEREAMFSDSLGKAHALGYAGIAVGAALVITGVALVIVDAKKRGKQRQRARVHGVGLAVNF